MPATAKESSQHRNSSPVALAVKGCFKLRHGLEQVGPHVDRRAHQESAGAAAHDRESVLARDAFRDQVFWQFEIKVAQFHAAGL